jgi:hypothetical protein
MIPFRDECRNRLASPWRVSYLFTFYSDQFLAKIRTGLFRACFPKKFNGRTFSFTPSIDIILFGTRRRSTYSNQNRFNHRLSRIDLLYIKRSHVEPITRCATEKQLFKCVCLSKA